MSKQRLYLTAVAVNKGVITLIAPNGELKRYAQRGIKKYNRELLLRFIRQNILDVAALSLPELPQNISIEFEDPIMGRAYATFNPKRPVR